MIKPASPVLTPDGLAIVTGLHSNVAGNREWWVKLVDGIERWYAEHNLTLLAPVAERDALAAHVEHIDQTIRQLNSTHVLPASLLNLVVKKPETSVARLKAQAAIEALEGMPLKGCFNLRDAISLRDSCVRVYRRQAEGE